MTMTLAGLSVVVVGVLVACASGAAGAAAARGGRAGVPPAYALAGEMDGQIIGGHEARLGEFPHQVSMQVVRQGFLWFDAAPRHICGGSLIYPGWVLTAAHCVVGSQRGDVRRVEVFMGINDIDPDVEAGGQRFVVSKMIYHEKYDPYSNGGVGPFDIGLLKLEGAAVLSDAVKLARLPDFEDIPKGEAVLSGWGSMNSDRENPKMPYKLQTITLPIVDFDTCKSFLDRSHSDGSNPLVDTNVCTGPLDKAGLASCGSDSGGPLIQTDEDGQAVVVGIVSWGAAACGASPYPSVYTRTSAFLDWITDKINHE